MKMPEYMSLTTNNLFVSGVQDLLNTEDDAEREIQAFAISTLLDDMNMDFFTFLKLYISTIAIINMVKGTHPSSQDVERSEVLFKEIAYEMGVIATQANPILHLRIDDDFDDSFIRLCKHVERVELIIDNKDDYGITFTDGKITIS